MLCEIHCHSRYSDGLPTVEAILKKAVKKVQVLAITDHNTMSGYEHAKKIMQNGLSKHDLILIPGVEITATKTDNRHCHILAIGLQELKKGIPLSAVADVIDYIHSEGAVAIAAHPFRQRQNIDANDAIMFDALEVINGNTFKEGNKRSRELAEQLKKPMTSGSDAHLVIDIGRFAFQIKGSDVDEILKNIKNGKAILPNTMPSKLHLFTRKTGGKAFRKLSSYRRTY